MSRCDGLIDLSEDELVRRLGEPAARKTAGGDVWLVFRSPAVDLRVRCEGEDASRVVSWTATFSRGHRTLREAAADLGLWPAAAPDEKAEADGVPLIRRSLACPGTDRKYSLTATVRGGSITQISVFNEPPDWL
jgi:hypothetical protein